MWRETSFCAVRPVPHKVNLSGTRHAGKFCGKSRDRFVAGSDFYGLLFII